MVQSTLPYTAHFVAKSSSGHVLAETSVAVPEDESENIFVPEFIRWKAVVEANGFFRITVDVSPTKLLPPSSTSSQSLLVSKTLSNVLKGDNVVDTKFILFSRHFISGNKFGAARPRPVFANSMLLASVSEYFQTREYRSSSATVANSLFLSCKVLTGEFADSNKQDFEANSEELIEEYDYPSDSDLDTESEEESKENNPIRRNIDGALNVLHKNQSDEAVIQTHVLTIRHRC